MVRAHEHQQDRFSAKALTMRLSLGLTLMRMPS
jgi:hypothetical protein